MNSAIQCLSHATPLTRHFLSGRYQNDINRTNPLGTGGQLAVAYADTIKLLHHTRASSSSISPTKLKHAIAMFAPRFAGFLQHDAQEFLAYLLDGLHEDVNRIRNAPYVEMPDVTDGQCIAIAGAKAWEAHRKRNDSVVLDTFYGQFKSTCVCPNCQRVSVSFDVYNHISLEIPQETNDNIPMVVIVYASPSMTNPFPKPTRYAVSISRNTSTVSDLVQALSVMCHIPIERLHICEEHHGTITIHENRKPLSSFRRNIVLIAYELYPLQGSSEESDPVFHAVLCNQLIIPEEELVSMEPTASTAPVTSSYERIGIPILTSFIASYTCREVWNHIWSILEYFAGTNELYQDDSTQFASSTMDSHSDARNMLQIRLVVQTNGKERLVFPASADNVLNNALNRKVTNALDTTNDVEMKESESAPKEILFTSILPKDSDETLLKYVGIDQLRNFVYFDCVWITPELTTQREEPILGDPTISVVTPTATTPTMHSSTTYRIDEDRFYSVMNHTSYVEYIQKSNDVTAKKNVVTLDDCLDTFTRPERLDVQNMWYCSRCKDHVRALKTMELWKLPNVLIIHLKRFEYKHSLRRDKLDHLVDFPLYGLDMNQHCGGKYHLENETIANGVVDTSIPAVYDCFAVVNHYGRMGFGHYTAYARAWNEEGFISTTNTAAAAATTTTNTPENHWNLFDDSHVRSVPDERSVVSSAAYVLLYRRRIFH
jgi:ubiquitin carboxyl-terminal hydrolase 4/11/15